MDDELRAYGCGGNGFAVQSVPDHRHHLRRHAHRDYLDRRGMPAPIADMVGHDLIGVDSSHSFSRAMLGALPGLDHADFAIRADSTVVHLAAICAGFGIGICQVAIAARDANSMDLRWLL